MQTLRHTVTAGVTTTPAFFSLDNNENYAFIGIKRSFFHVLAPDIEI